MKHGATIEQAAERFEVSISGLYRLIKVGTLHPIKQDGETLLDLEELVSVFHALCPICGAGFKRGNQRQRFCSQACRQKANRRASH